MTARRPRSSLARLVLPVVLAAGCATLPAARPIGPEARQALDALTERWREFSGLRTLAEVTVERGADRHHLRAVVLARPPASVRFEALSPVGQPLLLTTIHDAALTAWDATTNEAFVGPASAEATGRILGLPFEPADLVAVLAGHAVPPANLRVAELAPPDEFGPSLELEGANRRQIWLDPATGQVRQLVLTAGRGDARIRYRRDERGGLRGFEVTALDGRITASVRYENPAFGVDLPDDAFTFSIPKTAKIRSIR